MKTSVSTLSGTVLSATLYKWGIAELLFGARFVLFYNTVNVRLFYGSIFELRRILSYDQKNRFPKYGHSFVIQANWSR